MLGVNAARGGVRDADAEEGGREEGGEVHGGLGGHAVVVGEGEVRGGGCSGGLATRRGWRWLVVVTGMRVVMVWRRLASVGRRIKLYFFTPYPGAGWWDERTGKAD